MKFVFDPVKSLKNEVKHGIDFDAAQALWDDDRLLELPARVQDEVRVLAIGKIGYIHWAAVYTPCNDAIRLISVRRARKMEVEYYESQ